MRRDSDFWDIGSIGDPGMSGYEQAEMQEENWFVQHPEVMRYILEHEQKAEFPPAPPRIHEEQIVLTRHDAHNNYHCPDRSCVCWADERALAKAHPVLLTTMQQVNRHRRAGDLLFCACLGNPRVEVQAIRYGQGAFQIKRPDSDEWETPLSVWADEREAFVHEPDEEEYEDAWDALQDVSSYVEQQAAAFAKEV